MYFCKFNVFVGEEWRAIFFWTISEIYLNWNILNWSHFQCHWNVLLCHFLSLCNLPQQLCGIRYSPAIGDQTTQQHKRHQHAGPLHQLGHGNVVHPHCGIADNKIWSRIPARGCCNSQRLWFSFDSSLSNHHFSSYEEIHTSIVNWKQKNFLNATFKFLLSMHYQTSHLIVAQLQLGPIVQHFFTLGWYKKKRIIILLPRKNYSVV